MAGIPYFVNGSKLYNITYTTDAFGVRTYTANDVSGAESIDGTASAIMSENGVQLCIVAPDYSNQFNAWIYTVAGGLVQITDADFDGPVSCVTYNNGAFIFAKTSSNKWFKSALRDGFSYNAVDYTSAEADPDAIVRIYPLNGLMYVFGTKTVQPYQNLDTSGFPYEAITSAVLQKGCSAANSIIEVDGSLFFIGAGDNERPAIYATDGGKPLKVSTPAVDNLIFSGGIALLQKAYAIRWSERGHTFVSFTVPSVCTLVFDTVTARWHERKSIDVNSDEVPWRAASVTDAYSVLFCGDNLSGNIGILSESTFYEYDIEMRRYFTPPALDNEGKPFSLHAVQLLAETGTVPITGQGSDPIVRLSLSYDGGRTYTPEIERSMGLIGAYYSPIVWPSLGRFYRSACVRIDTSEPIKIVFVKLEVEIGS
jgi:hypothetical protein